MEKGISVVIPNYNGVQLCPHTLPTVFNALSTLQLPYELLVVDDCSPDGSAAFLQKNFADVRVIANEKNSGFVLTANRAVRNAQYDIVLLLNSDVQLTPNYFESQLKYFEREDTFGVMGRIIGWDDNIIQDGAKYPSFHGVKIKTSGNYLLENEEEMRDGLYSMYLSGANALMDKKKFLAMGGLNESFVPIYVEDYELSLRAWRLGWKCYYQHDAVCRHKVSTTMRSKEKENYVKKIYNRNKMFLHAIHLSKGERLLWMIQLVAEVIVQTVLLKLFFLKGFILFVKNYDRVKDSRQKLVQVASGKNLLSVKEVADLIVDSVKGKKIRRFLSGQG
jgi:GT2 family glycosyltransferase